MPAHRPAPGLPFQLAPTVTLAACIVLLLGASSVAAGMLFCTAALAQQSGPTPPKESGHYLPKPGATAEDFSRDLASCRMRAEMAVPLVWDNDLFSQLISQRRIVANCMRANGWIWTTAAPTAPASAPNNPPSTKNLPTAKNLPAAVHKSKPLEPVKAGSGGAYVTTSETSTLNEVLNARGLGEPTDDPRWRTSLAHALHRYCESVLVQVPRNTPEEDQWIDSELHDASQEEIKPDLNWQRWPERVRRHTERIKRVENSVQQARKYLRLILSGCSFVSQKLIELKPTTQVAEALLWLQLSRPFSSDKHVLRLAETVGLISPNYCSDLEQHLDDLGLLSWDFPPGAHDENDICSWGSVHAAIIYHAVIPLLEGNRGQ